MQDLIIAMLAISAILILRGHGKNCLWGEKKEDPVYDCHPQKERMEQYAQSLQKLADTFYQMPCRRERLSNSEIEGIFSQKCRINSAADVRKKGNLLEAASIMTCQKVCDMLCLIEEGNAEKILRRTGRLVCRLPECRQSVEYLQDEFQNARRI